MSDRDYEPVDLDRATREISEERLAGHTSAPAGAIILADMLERAVAELREHRERNRPNWHRLDFPPVTDRQIASAIWRRTSRIYDSVLLDSGVDIQPSRNDDDRAWVCARPQRNSMRVEFLVAALDALDGFTIDEWRVGNIGRHHPVIFANPTVVNTAQDIVVIVRRTANTPGRFCVRVAGETIP